MKNFILFTVIIIVLSSSCTQREHAAYKAVDIYYITANVTTNSAPIKPQRVKIPSQSTPAEITSIFEMLKSGTDNSDYKSAFPVGLTLNEVKAENGVAFLDLSNEYNYLSDISRTLANACLTLSLCELGEITSVTVTVDGSPPRGGDNIFTRADFVENILGLMNYENNLILYFINQDKTALVPEIRHTVARENESEVELAIAALMDGPMTPGLKPVIPKNTRLLSINTDRNICYLNLSRDFLNNRDTDERAELLTIYSIVNSLTELPDVTDVQFLIEGKRVKGFTHCDLSNPFERNLDV